MHRVQVAENVGIIGIGLLQICEDRVDRQLAVFLIQFPEGLATLLFPAWQLAHDDFQLFFEGFNVLERGFTRFFRQRLEILGADDFAVFHRRQRVARGRLNHRNIFLCRALCQRLEGFLLTFLELLAQFLHTGLVLVALEGRGHDGQQFLHRVQHVAAKAAAHALWKP